MHATFRFMIIDVPGGQAIKVIEPSGKEHIGHTQTYINPSVIEDLESIIKTIDILLEYQKDVLERMQRRNA